MKFIRKDAYYIGYTMYRGERFYNFACPNKKCAMGVTKGYKYCPYCGQKLRFGKVPNVRHIDIRMANVYEKLKEELI